MKEQIVAKALRCIDEVYPAEDSLNESYFPTETFIDEMVRWVIDIVPVHYLTKRCSAKKGIATVDAEGVGTFAWATEGRIVYVKASDWKRPVYGVISESHPLYAQQCNKVLRGNPSRPIAALVDGKTRLELYTMTSSEFESQYVSYDIENIPESLISLAAWKLAELVLTSMSDVQSAGVCASKVNEHLQMLVL